MELKKQRPNLAVKFDLRAQVTRFHVRLLACVPRTEPTLSAERVSVWTLQPLYKDLFQQQAKTSGERDKLYRENVSLRAQNDRLSVSSCQCRGARAPGPSPSLDSESERSDEPSHEGTCEAPRN
jgi:hypothetical protein